MVLSYDPLVARTRAGRSSYAFIHVSAYGPEFSRHPPPLIRTSSGMCQVTLLVRDSASRYLRPIELREMIRRIVVDTPYDVWLEPSSRKLPCRPMLIVEAVVVD